MPLQKPAEPRPGRRPPQGTTSGREPRRWGPSRRRCWQRFDTISPPRTLSTSRRPRTSRLTSGHWTCNKNLRQHRCAHHLVKARDRRSTTEVKSLFVPRGGARVAGEHDEHEGSLRARMMRPPTERRRRCRTRTEAPPHVQSVPKEIIPTPVHHLHAIVFKMASFTVTGLTIDAIPPALLQSIYSVLDPRALARCICVSRTWRCSRTI